MPTNENIILEIEAPQIDLRYVDGASKIGKGKIFYFIFFVILTFGGVLSRSSKAYIAWAIILGLLVFTAIVVKVIKVISKLRHNKLPEAKRLKLYFTERSIRIPMYLRMGKKDESQDEYFDIPYDQLRDFTLVPATKYKARHFSVRVFQNGLEEEYSFQNTTTKEADKLIQEALETKLPLDRSDGSNFSPKSFEIRKQKNKLSIIIAITFVISIMISTFLFLFYKPLYLFSSVLFFLVYSVLMAGLMWIGFSNTKVNELLNLNYGMKISKSFYAVVLIMFSLTALISFNCLAPSPRWGFKAIIIKKQIKLHKGKRRYHITFEIPEMENNLFKVYDNTSSVQTRRKRYEKIVVGKSEVNIKYALGALGVPIILSNSVDP